MSGSDAILVDELKNLKSRMVQLEGGRDPDVLATDDPYRLVVVEIWTRFASWLPHLGIFPQQVSSDAAFRTYRLDVTDGMQVVAPYSDSAPTSCNT